MKYDLLLRKYDLLLRKYDLLLRKYDLLLSFLYLLLSFKKNKVLKNTIKHCVLELIDKYIFWINLLILNSRNLKYDLFHAFYVNNFLSDDKMSKKDFFTDLNIIDLPIFSASKKIKSNKQKETIKLEKNNQVTLLEITYPEDKLTFFDRKILGTIEYLYCQLCEFSNLKKEITISINQETKNYLKKFNIDNENDLSQAEKQQIIFTVLERIKTNHKLYISLKSLNIILDKELYNHTNIKKSLLKLSETTIHNKSNYLLDNSNIEYSFKLLDVTMAETEKNKRQNIIIGLNPFHFYNLINSYAVKANLQLLNSFRQPIAGRLSELLSKALYGSKLYKKNKVVYDYQYICEYLQIEKRKSESLILQQLKKPFDELIEKKIIVNWLLQKNLFDYDVEFYQSFSFYADYYNRLDKDLKIKINKGIANITKQPDKYKEFKDRIDDYLSNSNTDKKELDYVKTYYSKYLFLNEYMD
jgi:hypothetical protein